jgi:transcriptional regulator PpsR
MSLRDLGVLSQWAPELAHTFASLSSDIALVLDDSGVIRNVAHGVNAVLTPASQEWVGRHWADTVTGETRGKIELLLNEAKTTGLARKREINHPTAEGGHIAVSYTAIRLGKNGPLLAVGRDLGAIVAIQQRFLDAQQEMERGYWQVRQAEARYRMLFQVATDAILVVDAQTFTIMEVNQAASQMFDLPVDQMLGRVASFGFERFSRGAVDGLLSLARSSGLMSEIRARLLGKVTSTSVAATPFRSGDEMRLLMRVRSMDAPGSATDLSATLARLVDSSSDGVVVTDSNGLILIANPAFLKLVRMKTEASVKGRPLMDWVGVSDHQFSTLFKQVRQQGIKRGVCIRVLAADANLLEVEMSATLLTEGDQECIGFTLHSVTPSVGTSVHAIDCLKMAIEYISTGVGGAPLPDLLLKATALLERHFIAVAMERTSGDPAAAANLLRISPDRLARERPDASGINPECS